MMSVRNICRTGGIILILSLFHNCATYDRVTPEKAYLESDKVIKLHHGTDHMYMTDIKIHETYIEGLAKETYVVYNKKTGSNIVQEPDESQLVHIYLYKPLEEYSTSEYGIRIPLEAIEVLETYEKNTKKNFAIGMGVTIGAAGVTLGVVVGLVALLKSSCPFIYCWDGTKFSFTGEIFSGAVFPAIERHDYLRLTNIKPDGDRLEFMIVNEVKEIQHINLLELIVIHHNKGVKAMIDKYGKIHASDKMDAPLSAVDHSGKDILDKIIQDSDMLTYNGAGELPDTSLVQQLVLRFNKPAKDSIASLFIRAKNNSWLDYSYMKFHDQLGKYYDRWFIKQQKAKAEDLQQWSFDQKIPLIVYLDRNGTLEYQDHFNVCGPMAFKEDVLSIDLSGIEEDEFTLVLESGFKFWEIDYVGVSFDDDIEVEMSCIQATQAITNENTDVNSLVQIDDEHYYLQPEIGDGAIVSFPAPVPQKDKECTLILHSKGYYDILMDPPDFRPRFRDLKKLKKPLAFTRFSRDYFLDIYQHQLISEVNEK